MMKAAAGCTGTKIHVLEITIPPDVDLITALAIFYSVVPWLTGIATAFFTYRTRGGFLPASTLGLKLLMLFINETVLKRIFNERRPIGSCLTSNGMPSSHSMISVGVFTLLLLQIASMRWRESSNSCSCKTTTITHNNASGDNSNSSSSSKNTSGNKFSLGFSWGRKRKVFGAAAAAAVIFLPVPLSRVWLLDHSVRQVQAGGILGFLFSVLYFAVLRFYMPLNF